MISKIYRIKPESQETKKFKIDNLKLTIKVSLFLLSFSIFHFPFSIPRAYAIVDPLTSPNNKFGIHIISPTSDESLPAAELVNSSGGDWGYVTIIIQKDDMKQDKWQSFFNDLRRRHLIPIVRLATQPQGNYWQMPEEKDAAQWANFLDSLIWPTKNRYVTIYNEPNQGQEWQGRVDAALYAKILEQTITTFKNKNQDFFVLNAGLDASAPAKPPLYEDELNYLKEMNKAVPGIFNQLDGWVSHSYPNPGFVGSPNASGKGTVRTWFWEVQRLRELGVTKQLPIFITETGWKHSNGKIYDKSLPSPETVGEYLQEAFETAWNSERIVAVTPFLLTYQDDPFDHFSFKKLSGETQDLKILGVQEPEYYPQYFTMSSLPKNAGRPVQEEKASIIKGEIYPIIVSGETYEIPFVLRNDGQSIWNEYEKISFRITSGEKELGATIFYLQPDKKVEPGETLNFKINLRAPAGGAYKLSLLPFRGDKPFNQPPFDYTVEVKSPVMLFLTAFLNYKNNPAGNYTLSIRSNDFKATLPVELNEAGRSAEIEARYLLPEHDFTFTLNKPFYKTKSIDLKVRSGLNQLNFGTLEPDFVSALLKPKELWQLLPFSN